DPPRVVRVRWLRHAGRHVQPRAAAEIERAVEPQRLRLFQAEAVEERAEVIAHRERGGREYPATAPARHLGGERAAGVDGCGVKDRAAPAGLGPAQLEALAAGPDGPGARRQRARAALDGV